MSDFVIKSEPFTWNDNKSEVALEDFESMQKNLPYCVCQNIGTALAKLKLLEEQGAKVKKSLCDSCKHCEEGWACEAYIKSVAMKQPKDCEKYNPISNGDKVRRMGDDEFACFLYNAQQEIHSHRFFLEWLQKEVE